MRFVIDSGLLSELIAPDIQLTISFTNGGSYVIYISLDWEKHIDYHFHIV